LDTLDEIVEERANVEIRIEWTPGHEGIEGNESADSAPKRDKIQKYPMQSRMLKSVQVMHISRAAVKQASESWNKRTESTWQHRRLT
jgi:hypothetical protein